MTMQSAKEKLSQLVQACITDGVTNSKGAEPLCNWFLAQFNPAASGQCTLESFAVYFLNAMRQHIEVQIRANETDWARIKISTRQDLDISTQLSGNDLLEVEQNLHFSNDVNEDFSLSSLSLSRNQHNRSQTSTSNQSVNSNSSTPVWRHNNNQKRSTSNFTNQYSSTPNKSHDSESHRALNRSGTGTGAIAAATGGGICLGDFLLPNVGRSQRSKKSALQPLPITGVNCSPNVGQRKKRVVPTTISRPVTSETGDTTPFGSGSSFGHENNILPLAHTELEDRSQCNVLAARKALKHCAGEISRELQMVDILPKEAALDSFSVGAGDQIQQLNLNDVSDCAAIDGLANIYAALMDLNFITNVLNEISFLVNLLNAQTPITDSQIVGQGQSPDTAKELDLTLLTNFVDCAYFAKSVLEREQHTLALLDFKSLSVILQSERLCQWAPDLTAYLHNTQHQKHNLEVQKMAHTPDAASPSSKSIQNVHFQVESDSRQHFTSHTEFGAFKTQRDLFYQALKLWQQRHLSPTWSYALDLRPIIADIFRQSESAVNMAHFAKLFVAQLLIASSDLTSSEDIGLTMDQEKLSKLTQRLVAPSSCSSDYQFPRNQLFFRDFIIEARSLAFAAQLKMALYHQLRVLNDSKYDQINLRGRSVATVDDDDDDGHAAGQHQELIVRPEKLASLLLLAKFMGFVTSQPYMTSGGCVLSAGIESRQLMLRSLFQTDFDVCRLIADAIKAGKLLITLPWLVQYLAMLDNLTLQLTHYSAAMELLFSLYAQLGRGEGQPKLMPTSIFILRCCLGWLFEEKPLIAEQYHSYRARHPIEHGTIHLHAEVMAPDMNQMLETQLPVACPFLAEFRVSIMLAKHAQTKYVSRNGRYRYITLSTQPLYQQTPVEIPQKEAIALTPEGTRKKLQQKLLETFLHAQNSKMRRVIEFITERTYKSAVKDGQYRILLPSKIAADKLINAITSNDHNEVYAAVKHIYTEAAAEAGRQWYEQMPPLIVERIRNALDALLPAETAPAIKSTYQQLIRRNSVLKVSQWWHANVLKSGDFYCSDYNELAAKICKVNSKERTDVGTSSDLQLLKEFPSISDLLDELQHWLHCTSMPPNMNSAICARLYEFLQQLLLCFTDNVLPTVFYRLVGVGVIQLLQHLITFLPQIVSEQLIQEVCNILRAPAMQAANELSTKMPTITNNYDTSATKILDADEEEQNKAGTVTPNGGAMPNIYDVLVTVAFIKTLCAHRMCYEKLGALLVALIRQHIIAVDFVNVLFVPIFKVDWHPQVLNEISLMLRNVAHDTADVRSTTSNLINGDAECDEFDDGKSHLFMEVLADLSRDTADF